MGIPIARQNGVPENRIVRSGFCKALDFFMVKVGLPGPPPVDEFHALFKGPASDENINPVTGLPRPTPDPAIKTKRYRVPLNLQLELPLRKPPSRFSGKMREAAGCFSARGEDVPFDHGVLKTHGIFYVDVPLVPGPGTTRVYWLIEIGPSGVFATQLRVTATSTCCGSWGVEHLKPTLKEVAAVPARQEYRDTISLEWYWLNRGGTVVKRIMIPDKIAPAIGTGWYVEHGWAFSASGAKAQQVTVSTGTIDGIVPCWVGARYELTFTGTDKDVTCALNKIEENKKYTLMIDRTVWYPTSGEGDWQGFPGPGIASLQNPIQKLPNQDAPVFVYFVGEVAQVVRWTMNYSTVAAVDTRTAWADMTPLVEVPGRECVTENLYSPGLIPASGSLIGADTIIVCGFTGPGFAAVGTNRGPRNDSTQQGFTGGAEVMYSEFFVNNRFDIQPPCWFYFDDGIHGPQIQTQCVQPEHTQSWKKDRWTATETVSFSAVKKSSVVLFMEEREAVLCVELTSSSRTGTGATDFGQAWKYRDKMTMEPGGITPAACPPHEWDITGSFGDIGPASADHSSSYAIDEHATTASATLALGAFNVVYPISVPVDPLAEIDDAFGTFLKCRVGPPLKETAESHVGAMKGNTTDADRWYYLDPVAPSVAGGFVYTEGEPIAFVGKV